jgi:hypothetical protein
VHALDRSATVTGRLLCLPQANFYATRLFSHSVRV